MRPAWKLSACPLSSLLYPKWLFSVVKLIVLYLKPFSGSPLLQIKYSSLKWYRTFSMIWPLIFSWALSQPMLWLQSPWVSFESSRVTLLIPTCASGLIVDITYSENFPWHIKSGFGPPPLCSLCILRSPWPTFPSILEEWTYEWIGLSWKCVILVRGSSGCNRMGDGLRTIPAAPGVATLADYHRMFLYEMPRP